MQLVNQDQERVQLPDGSEARSDFAQPTGQATRAIRLELEQRQDTAQPARRDTRLMQGNHVALFESGERARQSAQTFLEQLGSFEHGSSRPCDYS